MQDETKHTPGPWTAFQRPAEIGTNYFRILFHGYPDRQDAHGQDSLAGYCGWANARLIAAAPELLEALQILVGQYDASGDFTMGGKLTNDGFLKGRAAIAKATGKP